MTDLRNVLTAAADRIENSGWASHYQQPGVTFSDAIALATRDVPGTNVTRASLLTAAFEAVQHHIAAVGLPDWLRDTDRTQAEIVAALREAAEQATETR